MNTKRAKSKLSRIKLLSKEIKSEALKMLKSKNRTNNLSSYKVLKRKLHFLKSQCLLLLKILRNNKLIKNLKP